MSLLPPVFTALRAAPAVVDIVGTRIYRHGRAPQDAQAPYITWFLASASPQHTLSEAPTVDRCQLQLDCYHSDDAGVEALAEAVRAAIEAEACVTGTPINNFDALGTRLFRIAITADWLHARG
jgi:hypothetical protein